MAAVTAFSLGCGPGSDSGEDEECDDPSECEAADADDDDDDDDDDAPGDDDDDAAAGDIPCDIQDLLESNCWECHDDPVAFGAPMPLRTVEDFRIPAITDATVSVADLVGARVVDEGRPMPPNGFMPEESVQRLQDWIDAGTPGDEDAGACNSAGDDDDDDDDWGPDALPCEPDQVFLASANGNADEGGFEVPQTEDLYQCFVFDSPFSDTTQGTAWAPIIDDERVVHHWLLLKSTDPELQHGDVFPCAGLSLDTTMVVGWAPGTPNYVLNDDVGLELPAPGEKVVLQIHYNNAAGHTDAVDRSGVAVCTTDEKRENTAATLWLGNIDFAIPAGGSETVVGDCDTARLDEPVNMLLSWPHMHEYGTAIKTELIRGGTEDPEMLVDVQQWNFHNQIYYPHEPEIRVEPGDILRTTCEFTNPTDQTVTFGEGTGDEMCFNFAVVYPIDAFDFPNPVGPPSLGRYCLGGIPI